MAGAYFDNIVLEGVPRDFIDDVHSIVRALALQRGFGRQFHLMGDLLPRILVPVRVRWTAHTWEP